LSFLYEENVTGVQTLNIHRPWH